MTTDKKTNYWGYIDKTMKIIAFLGALGAIIAVFVAYGSWQEREANYKKNQKEVTFDNSKDKHKTQEHINSDYTPIKSYQKQQKLDSIYTFALEVFESNKEDKDDAIKSRAKRDSIIVETRKSQAKTDSVVIKILEKLNNIE